MPSCYSKSGAHNKTGGDAIGREDAAAPRLIPEAKCLRPLKLRFERGYNSAGVLGNVLKRVQYGDTVAKAYGDGSLVFHFHVRIRSRDDEGHAKELCFCVQRSPDNVPSYHRARQILVTVPPIRRRWGTNRDLAGADESRLDESVFVVVREIVKEGQGMRAVSIPSSVRLESLDRCPVARSESLKEPPLDPWGVEVDRTGRSRELGRLDFDTTCVHEGKLEDELIKGASEVVQHVSDEDTEPCRERVGLDKGDDPRTVISINFLPDGTTWGIRLGEELCDLSIECLKVFYAPSQFRPNAF